MRIITHLSFAAAVAITSLAASTAISPAMECRDVCGAFFPSVSTTNRGDYDCQDAIDDTGGFCTINGRPNWHKEMPRGIDYRGGSYRSIYNRSEVFDSIFTRNSRNRR